MHRISLVQAGQMDEATTNKGGRKSAPFFHRQFGTLPSSFSYNLPPIPVCA